MDIAKMTRKEVGNYGENAAYVYFLRHQFILIGRNVSRKTGEIDIIVLKNAVLHFVEVKTIMCNDFPTEKSIISEYNPGDNLHALKIKKVQRTSEWFVAEKKWEGEVQIDGALVWVRRRDGVAKVRYIPQIL